MGPSSWVDGKLTNSRNASPQALAQSLSVWEVYFRSSRLRKNWDLQRLSRCNLGFQLPTRVGEVFYW